MNDPEVEAAAQLVRDYNQNGDSDQFDEALDKLVRLASATRSITTIDKIIEYTHREPVMTVTDAARALGVPVYPSGTKVEPGMSVMMDGPEKGAVLDTRVMADLMAAPASAFARLRVAASFLAEYDQKHKPTEARTIGLQRFCAACDSSTCWFAFQSLLTASVDLGDTNTETPC